MRYLSVCSGVEAVSVAWGSLGWQPAMFAETDPFCGWHKALGNSMAVPVMRWIGKRIGQVDAIVRATGSASRFSS